MLRQLVVVQISLIDTTSFEGRSGDYTELSGPAITETVPGEISEGTHTITLPADWEFDIGSDITIMKFGSNMTPSFQTVTPETTSFTFVVDTASTDSSATLGFSGLRVRPTGTESGISGEILHSGAPIAGVINEVKSFGTLSTITGTVTQLAFSIQPSDAEYGSILDSQPEVETQDQFGNHSTNGLDASKTVTLTLTSGTGNLLGMASLDIGTDVGNGTVIFTDLTVNQFGIDKILTASAIDLTDAVSSDFEITKKPLTATITVNDKDYDGNNTTTNINVILDGIVGSDVVEADFSVAIAIFDDVNANDDVDITTTGVTLTGDDALNYTLADEDIIGTANINPLEITVTPTSGQNKVYGNADPIFAYTFNPALISPDVFSGNLSRVASEDVGTYAYTLGTLEDGLDNYTLILDPATFEITPKDLTVTATGIDKEYDTNTIATVILSSVDEEAGDNLVYTYTSALFLDKTAVNGKTVNVSGISISGAKATNYSLQSTTAVTTANITKKPITATINLNNKTYNGNTNAVYSSTNPRVANGVIDGDIVVVENTGSKAFVDKHVGVDKTVNAIGLTLSGADASNYQFDGTGAGTATISVRLITITATTDTKTYDGTNASINIPTITSGALQGSDTIGFTQTYNNDNVGVGKTVTPSGIVNDGNSGNNYSYTFVIDTAGVITTKSINVTAQTDTKIYDGTTDSSVAPEVDTLEAGDTIGTPPIQVYDTKDVGTSKTLTASGLVVSDGNSGLNYDIQYINDTTGVINAKNLTVSGAATDRKTYDGNVTATVDFTSAGLVNVVSDEEALVSLNSGSYSAVFDNENVGAGKTITVSGLVLTGTGASNYSLTQPVFTDGVINDRTLTVTATGINRVYDATINATVNLLDDRIGVDDITFGYTAAFTDKNVGNGKTVNISAISITGGADASNYTLGNTTAATTADITSAPLTATVTVNDKVFDGNTSATITGVILNGVLLSDIVTIDSQGTATFADAAVGNGKIVTAAGVTITGTDTGNYTYDGTATGVADILPIPTVVYVDDSWIETTLWEDPDGAGLATAFGYDAFATIQEGIDAVADEGTVNIEAGIYNPFSVIERNKLMIIGSENVITEGIQNVVTNYGNRDAVVFVKDSTDIVLQNLGIEGNDLGTINAKNYGIIYEASSGEIKDCIVSPNTIGDMLSMGIGIWDGSDVTVDSTTLVENFGRVGIFIYNGVTATIEDSTIIGQVYSGEGEVSYGIEIEGAYMDADPATASQITIRNNEIYNCDNTFDGTNVDGFIGPLWESGGIYVNGWLEHFDAADSTVIIEDNEIHDNYVGIIVIKSPSSYAHNNKIYNNRLYGVYSGEAYDETFVEFDATANWWGDTTGPYHLTNVGGTGNAVSGNVDFRPWYTILNPDGNFPELDQTAPTVEEISTTASDPTNVSPIPVTVTFSEEVSDFIVDDIAVTDGTASNLSTSDNIIYTVNITPDIDYQGVITVNIAANVSWDLAGNYNTIATGFSITFDQTVPTLSSVTIVSNNTNSPVGTLAKVGDTITLSFTSNETIQVDPTVTFTSGGIAVTGVVAVTNTESNDWTATYEMADGDSEGAVAFAIDFIDLAGNSGTTVTTGTGSVTFDKTAPAVPTIISIAGDEFINNSEKGAIVVVGTAEADALVSVSLINGATVSGTQQLTGGDTAYSITINGTDLTDGTIIPSVTATDATGNVSAALVIPTAVKDTVVPTVDSHTPGINAINVESGVITIIFSDNMIVDTEDIIFNPAATFVITGSGTEIVTLTPDSILDSNTVYTITITTNTTDEADNGLAEAYDWQFTTATLYDITLNADNGGWNLVSLPVVPNNMNISTVLGDAESNINAVWTYDLSNPNAIDGWLVYTPNNSPETNNITVMTAGYGYWISVTGNTTISGSGGLLSVGPTTPPSRNLTAGWNLVGYYQIPGEDSSVPANAFASLGGITGLSALYGFNNSFGSFVDVTTILPGDAFWVSLPSAKTYTPSNL